MSRELVSIVIPCYGQAHLLPRAIRSCLEQSYSNIEIIVVDDGSPDNVTGATEPFMPRVRLVRQENQGLSSARNAGLAVASGAYVKFLDSDDWLLPNCIEWQWSSLCRLDGYVSAIGYRIWHDTTGTYGEEMYPDFGRLSHALCYINTGPPHTYLFPTEAIKKINGFDTTDRVDGGHEDYDLLCRLSLQGYEVVALHTIGCVYRRAPNSMSTNLDGMRRSRKRVWQHFATEMLKNECEPSQLVHLLGGYILRLRSSDIRYEVTEVLEQIVRRLEDCCDNISSDLAATLCHNVVALRRNLPKPKDRLEAEYRRVSLTISDRLAALAIKNLQNGPPPEAKWRSALIGLAKSYFTAIDESHLRGFVDRMRAALVSKKLFHMISSLLGLKLK